MLVHFPFAIQSVFYLFGILSFSLFAICFYLNYDNCYLYLIIALFNCLVAFLTKIFSKKFNNEGFKLVKYLFLMWFVIILLSAMPILTLKSNITFNQALFLATSFVTTTGFSIPDINFYNSFEIKLWRSISQLVGSYYTLTLNILLVSLFFSTENRSIIFNRKVITQFLFIFLLILLLFTVIFVTIDKSIMDSFLLSSAILSSGGMVDVDNHILKYELSSNEILSVITIMMLLSLLITPIFFYFTNKSFIIFHYRNFLKRITLICIFVLITILSIGLFGKLSFIENIFIAISFITTTGMLPNNFENYLVIEHYKNFLFLFLILSMIGTFSMTTNGGFKINNVSLMFINLKDELNKLIHQHNIKGIEIIKKGASQNKLNNIFSLFSLGVLLVIISSLILATYGVPLKNIAILVLSSLTNTGNGLIIFSNIENVTNNKIYFVLNILMICGRFETIGYLLLFYKLFSKS